MPNLTLEEAREIESLNYSRFWVIRDRRCAKSEVQSAIVNGDIHSVYFHPDAAKRDAFPTEVVWEIQIRAKVIQETDK